MHHNHDHHHHHHQSEPYIIKASGERSTFSRKKLWRSLKKAGARQEALEEILDEIEGDLHPGMSTRSIYKKAYGLLRKHRKGYAARYKLKQAIMELGPSGLPFEKFMGELLKSRGYTVEIGRIYQGYCVSHEVDVVARKNQRLILMECKYRNKPGFTCDVKVPLYIHSRFNDVVKKLDSGLQPECWIATNTRFTGDAIKYAECSGIRLISWDYPEQGCLRHWVDDTGLHPITSLTTLTKTEKNRLLNASVVLCRELTVQKLHDLDFPPQKSGRILAEARALCELERRSEEEYSYPEPPVQARGGSAI